MASQSHVLRRRAAFDFGSTMTASSPTSPKSLLCLRFKNPEDNYIFIHKLPSKRGTLVCHRTNCSCLGVVRKARWLSTPLRTLEILARIHHPNIANILDAYFYEGDLLIIGEHLDVSLLDLGFQQLPAEEWEIATIIQQVVGLPFRETN
jgi:hypothetical protein